MTQSSGQLGTIRSDGNDKAVIFIHGFSGKRDDTWGRFPGFLGTTCEDWDIYTLGYASTFLPDITGVWSADPDLPILALSLQTAVNIEPLDRYQNLALVAHSMGGLVVQRALVDDEKIQQRTRKVALFGTPSGGLRKAGIFAFWKTSIRNMAVGSEFISDLRSRWNKQFQEDHPFELLTVAGNKDQFVPSWSSLDPFDAEYHRAIPGDHLSIVKPGQAQDPAVKLLTGFLQDERPKIEHVERGMLAAESPKFHLPVEDTVSIKALSEPEVVDLALSMDRQGKRLKSIELLEKHVNVGTDVQGTLAGRIKRKWFESEDIADAEYARELYGKALELAQQKQDHAQVYYLAINVAFLSYVAFDDEDKARLHAMEALVACSKAEENIWNTATRAEAALYLNDYDKALALYREVIARDGEEEWKHQSAGLQAAYIAAKKQNPDLIQSLNDIFSPGAKQVNRIFISYSHRDEEWKDRLLVHLKPYLRDGELQLWVDDQIRPGDEWKKEIDDALQGAGVAVALVSADFLASDFIHEEELPYIISGAKAKLLRLLWVHLSPAPYGASPISQFQSVINPEPTILEMPRPQQERAFLEIAKEIKAATLASTTAYTERV